MWRRPFWMPSKYLRGSSVASGTDTRPTRTSKSKVSKGKDNGTLCRDQWSQWERICGTGKQGCMHAGLECTLVHMFLLCTFYLLFNCLSQAQQLLSSLLPPPSQQMTTCFRSQGLTLVSWWFWKWRMQMERGPERSTFVSVNGELPFYKYLALPLSTAV